MAINPSNLIPNYCRNCTHRFVCDIQENIRNWDAKVKDYNKDNIASQQSTSASHVCRYKGIDVTIE